MTFGIQQTLIITICADASDATRQGFFYRAPVYLPIQIEQAVIVKKGTEEGNPTVDLVMEDEKGQKFAVMLTGKLIQVLAGAVTGATQS